MATQIKEMYDKVINFATNHENSLISTLTIIAVYVIQRVSFENAFQCPCDHTWAEVYGACILLCPAFILGMLSMMYHQFLWRRVKRTGLCCPSPASGESVVRASLPFFSWIILVMVDGEVADCFFQGGSDCSTPFESSNNETAIATTNTTTSSLTDVLKPMGNTSAKAISQILGLIVASLYVFAVLMCLFQKRKSKNYRDKFLKEHEKHEENELLESLQETAKKIAKSDVGILMANIETLKDDDWKKIEQQPYIKLKLQNGQEVQQIDKEALSGLHKLMKDKKNENSSSNNSQTRAKPPPKVKPRVSQNPKVESQVTQNPEVESHQACVV